MKNYVTDAVLSALSNSDNANSAYMEDKERSLEDLDKYQAMIWAANNLDNRNWNHFADEMSSQIDLPEFGGPKGLRHFAGLLGQL